jgi:transposase
MRLRSRVKPARPYICLLIILIRLTLPSAAVRRARWGMEDHGLTAGGVPACRCNEAPGRTRGYSKITHVQGASLSPQSAIPAVLPAGVLAAVSLSELVPHLRGLLIGQVRCAAAGVELEARSCLAGAACRTCGVWSSRVHSGYVRQVQDGPLAGRPVLIRLAVRRFFCGNPACPLATFAEQVTGLTARYRRRSLPLLGLLAQVGLALAGRAGARLAAVLGIGVHRSTLLSLVAALPEPQIAAAPQILGVDDFALRKGQVYGTVLVDITTGDAIDLLPDREAATLTAWLAAHPGAQVICRDRAGAYADGARAGAPDAIQIADRWHLWHNLGEYAEKTVVAHRGCLIRPAGAAGQGNNGAAGSGLPLPPPAAGQPGPADEVEGLRDVCGRDRMLVARTRDRHAAVHGLLAAGHSQREIGRILSLDRKTVRRFAAAANAGQLLTKATSRENKLDPYKPYLRQRWNEGITTASVLHAELQAQGWRGSVQAVARYVRPFRQLPAAPPPAPVVPKTRQITRWLLSHPAALTDDQHAQLAAIRARCPHLNTLAAHVSSFAEMMTGLHGQHLHQWLADVEADDQPQLHSFAAGIRRDLHAVTAGLTLPYSSGAAEGNVNRIKMIKRQMYGRAGFTLLRKRILLAA